MIFSVGVDVVLDGGGDGDESRTTSPIARAFVAVAVNHHVNAHVGEPYLIGVATKV